MFSPCLWIFSLSRPAWKGLFFFLFGQPRFNDKVKVPALQGAALCALTLPKRNVIIKYEVIVERNHVNQKKVRLVKLIVGRNHVNQKKAQFITLQIWGVSHGNYEIPSFKLRFLCKVRSF